MTRHFCTFFDKNFLARGLALYRSLEEHCQDFTIHMLCMDEESFVVLKALNLDKARLLRVSDVEDERMRAVKSTRTHVEYIWMFGAQLSLHMLEHNPNMDMVTYLDADMYFYSSPDPIYKEFSGRSVMIIPHRYSNSNLHREKTSGIYNVGMMVFRNDHNALECLRWWKDRVIEWCYNRYEDGKFGDQLYLNDWPTRFSGVHVLSHEGANVAPWNVARYTFSQKDGSLIGKDKISGRVFPLIFYHFHGLKIYRPGNSKGSGKPRIRPYPITIHERAVYRQYITALQRSYDDICSIEPTWVFGTVAKIGVARIAKQYITVLLTR